MSIMHSAGMTERANVAAVASLVAEPTRAAMLDALMAGGFLRAGELARRAGIAPSTASEHLCRLLEGRLIICEARGRERRYGLASHSVAEALEALARIAPPVYAHSLRASDRASALRHARTCYDHLAGRVGVALTEALVARKLLIAGEGAYTLTARGEHRLGLLGLDLERARAQRRSFARACIDWSERRAHLAGALGAALAEAVLDDGWLLRRPDGRALVVTPHGEAALCELGVRLPRDGREGRARTRPHRGSARTDG
jgi:DNA-binding transcriptional ArsR family regulator